MESHSRAERGAEVSERSVMPACRFGPVNRRVSGRRDAGASLKSNYGLPNGFSTVLRADGCDKVVIAAWYRLQHPSNASHIVTTPAPGRVIRCNARRAFSHPNPLAAHDSFAASDGLLLGFHLSDFARFLNC